MNEAVRAYVRQLVRRLPQDGKDVLDVGSYDVNGTVRDLFPDVHSYFGIDKRAGPGVDFVMDAHRLDAYAEPYKLFDTVLCLEMLEHDTEPPTTMVAIHSVLRDGGLVIVSARGIGYPIHADEDYWRFTAQGLRLVMENANFQVEEVVEHCASKGVFGYGFKNGSS